MDYTTPEGQVRLLIADIDESKPIFDDDAIKGYLAVANDSIKRAAADALDAIASSEALLSKKITTQDRSADGPAVADALRKHAAALRARAAEEEAKESASFFDAFDIVTSARSEGEELRP